MKPNPSYFLVGILVGLVLASALFAIIGQRSAQGQGTQQGRTLRVAHVLPTSHPVHRGIEHFAEQLEILSEGRLRLDIYPAGQLGNETQYLEQIQDGTLAIAKVSAATTGDFVSLMSVFSLPYLFRDDEHYQRVLDGEIGADLLERLSINDARRPSGFRGLCYYEAGSRNFYSKTPIRHPDDLRGKKIRVMSDPVAMDMVTAMGGAPTPIPFGELYTALRQGVVDGAENNPPSFLSSRHYEVCPHFTLDHHSRIPDLMVMSSSVWDSLSPTEKDWVQTAANKSSTFQRALWHEETERAMEEIRQHGVTIHEVDHAAFQEATQSVIERYRQGDIGLFIDRIQNMP